MNNRTSWIIQRELLLGALFCALLLVIGYFVLVSTPWGHQIDDDAFLGRAAMSRKVIDYLGLEKLHCVKNATN